MLLNYSNYRVIHAFFQNSIFYSGFFCRYKISLVVVHTFSNKYSDILRLFGLAQSTYPAECPDCVCSQPVNSIRDLQSGVDLAQITAAHAIQNKMNHLKPLLIVGVCLVSLLAKSELSSRPDIILRLCTIHFRVQALGTQDNVQLILCNTYLSVPPIIPNLSIRGLAAQTLVGSFYRPQWKT